MNTTRMRRTLLLSAGLVAAASLLAAGACGGGRSRPRTQPVRPSAGAPAAASLETLYEAGRHQEVVSAVSGMSQPAPEQLWLAGHSYMRLNRPQDARAQFERLGGTSDGAWQLVSQLALAVVDGGGGAIDRAAAAASAYPNQAYVQHELGLALAHRKKFAESATALDRSAGAAPDYAYTYYYAGLAYQRLDRVDLAAARFESFVRLAPQAPERAQVESILKTLRGR